MSTEIYLRIIKDMDPDDDPTGATTVAKLMSPIPLPGVICGDSLDVPFLKWIKLTGFKNSIGFDSGTVRSINSDGELVEQDYGTKSGSYKESRTAKKTTDITATGVELVDGTAVTTQTAKQKSRFHGHEKAVSRTVRAGGGQPTEWERTTPSAKKTRHAPNWKGWRNFQGFNNEKLQINLPDHGGIGLTKKVDNSTPQLAYACSCQEPIGTAVILFRSRIGLGVRGVRVPYLSIVLKQCLVSGWELNGEEETCTMSYQEIRWCTYDQIADFNIATGMSARWWDKDGKGGESAWMYIVMGLLGAATIAAAAVVPDGGSPSGSSTTSDAVLAKWIE